MINHLNKKNKPTNVDITYKKKYKQKSNSSRYCKIFKKNFYQNRVFKNNKR